MIIKKHRNCNDHTRFAIAVYPFDTIKPFRESGTALNTMMGVIP